VVARSLDRVTGHRGGDLHLGADAGEVRYRSGVHRPGAQTRDRQRCCTDDEDTDKHVRAAASARTPLRAAAEKCRRPGKQQQDRGAEERASHRPADSGRCRCPGGERERRESQIKGFGLHT